MYGLVRMISTGQAHFCADVLDFSSCVVAVISFDVSSNYAGLYHTEPMFCSLHDGE